MDARRDELLDLEAAITEVGRDRVFAIARANGWGSGDAPPTWVWWNIVAELRLARAATLATEVTDER